MSLEKGGRADKIGNQYENRFLAKLLIRLVEEQLISVIVEPLGEDGDGVEYVVETASGDRIFYQCKASNGAKDKWSPSDLNGLRIYEHAQKHVLNGTNSYYHFISPIPYDSLDDLCDRARTNNSVQDFVNIQLSNNELKTAFKKCEKYFGLCRENQSELETLVHILAHCRFELIPDGYESIADFESCVSRCFVGKASTARTMLENCVNDKRWFGIKITASQVTSYMEENGYPPRVFGADERILPRINTINNKHWRSISPINGSLFTRESSCRIIELIKMGKSVIVHGKAGAGKSGCIESTINALSNESIPYLAIKLDDYVPRVSADQFGNDIGLPESPIFCLNRIAPGKPCVLFLDQLDSLRWTAEHSASALAVCRELIGQAEALNKEVAKLSIVFVVRTFDLKTDTGIKSLFEENDSREKRWESIEVGLLSDPEVSDIVGIDNYCKLTARLKQLLKTPSRLYVWSQLEKESRQNNIASSKQMMDIWWIQILENCRLNGFAPESVEKTISHIIELMEMRNLIVLPKVMLSAQNATINALISNGLLVEADGKISFLHQSFLDYFLARRTITKVFEGEAHLVECVGNLNEQTPNLRYRLLSILQGIAEIDSAMFLDEANRFLESQKVRYYYKCAIFETVAQFENPSDDILSFAEKHLDDDNWRAYVKQTVYFGNVEFIKELINRKILEMLSDDWAELLRSINSNAGDFLVDTIEPCCFENEETDRKVHSILPSIVSDDSDRLYKLRLELLNKNPKLIYDGWFSFYESFKEAPDRAVDFLQFAIEKLDQIKISDLHLPEESVLKKFSKEHAEIILDRLLNLICSKSPCVDFSNVYTTSGDKWFDEKYTDNTLRKIIRIVKNAIQEVGAKRPEKIFEILNQEDYSQYLVGNELLLASFSRVPLEYADQIIGWLLVDFPQHIFDYTGSPTNFLDTAKQILERVINNCSDEKYYLLEKAVLHWKDCTEKMVRRFKRRVEISKDWEPVYYAYWGHMQKELLPILADSRQSTVAKDLIKVVARNNWIEKDYFHASVLMGNAKNVHSPIDGQENKLSDKAWMKIILTSPCKMKNRWSKETETAFIEANHESFAAAFRTAAKNEPERFAYLSLNFPEDVFPEYVSAVLQSLRNHNENADKPSTELSSEVIRKFWNVNDYIKREISDVIKYRAGENWPEEVLEIVQKISQMPQQCTSNFGEKDKPRAQDVHMKALNTPRGCALFAIASIVEHGTFNEKIKNSIELAANDPDESVRFACVSCVTACYDVDPHFAGTVFRNLVSQDIRVFTSPHAWYILYHEYLANSEFYYKKLVEACESDLEDLAKNAASFICGLAIFYEDSELTNYIINTKHSENVVRQICKQAISTFGKEEFHRDSKEILLHMTSKYAYEIKALGQLFSNKKIIVERDNEFLQEIMKTHAKADIVYSFLKFLDETDEDILCFADTIKVLGQNMELSNDNFISDRIVSKLAQVVIKLFDKGKNDELITQICLDVWDELFKSNLKKVTQISNMIDNID